jgi:uncharacterized caspase-like protein
MKKLTIILITILCVIFTTSASFTTPSTGASQGQQTEYPLELVVQQGHSGEVRSISFSPDGNYALSGSLDGTMKLWDISTGKEIRTFDGHSYGVWSVSFSPDGNYALSGSYDDNTMKLWDIVTGKEKRTFDGYSGAVYSVSFSPDGNYALSGSYDRTMRLWNIETGDSMVMMSAGDEWLIYTDDGYWDSSADGGELVAMLKGMDVWNIDQFAVRNNRPDIILDRMGLADDDYINHLNGQYLKRLRKLGLTEEDLSAELHVPTAEIVSAEQDGKFIELDIELDDTKYDLRSYNIYVNDVPIFGAYGKDIDGQHSSINHRVELTSGENKIEVSVMNEKASESFRALTFADYEESVTGDLYYLGFGVSEYADPDINDLGYAAKDAEDLADLFSRMEGNGFNKVHTRLYLDDEVTKESITGAKSFLDNASVDDTFVLFIAGHGLHEQDVEATYYYLTSDSDLDDISGTSADFDLIEGLLQGVAPRNKLFLMDTCGSGELDDETATGYLEDAENRGIKSRGVIKGLKKVDDDAADDRVDEQDQQRETREYLFDKQRYIYNDMLRRSGAIVVSSSKGSEFSYEDDSIANGFFTEGIIDAFQSGKADQDEDETISTDELRTYVLNIVPEMTFDLQHPTVDRDNIYQKFGFPNLD